MVYKDDLDALLSLPQEQYELLSKGARPSDMPYSDYKRYMRIFKGVVKKYLKGHIPQKQVIQGE